jgi:hypothetical protein
MPVTRTYYLLTPLFALLAYAADINIRLQTPWESGLFDAFYYLVCFAAPFFVFRTPVMGALFSQLECSANILLLLLSVMLPVLTAGEKLASGEPLAFEFGPAQLVHFILVGGVLAWVFHQNARHLQQLN